MTRDPYPALRSSQLRHAIAEAEDCAIRCARDAQFFARLAALYRQRDPARASALDSPPCPSGEGALDGASSDQEQAERWERQRREFVLTDESRIAADAMIRSGIALSTEPVTRDTALAAVLALAIVAVETDVTWTQLHDALRKEYDLAALERAASHADASAAAWIRDADQLRQELDRLPRA